VVVALGHDSQIEVVGTAIDPYNAREKILALKPDVLTLDVDMPRMDGITFLKILMKHHPMPIIVISALTTAGSEKALEALQEGAVDVLAKPTGSWSIGELSEVLAEKVKAAASANIRLLGGNIPAAGSPAQMATSHAFDPRKVVLIGVSTGGTEALKYLVSRLPANFPGICVAQHIPAQFSKKFAERLNKVGSMRAQEAADGDRVKPSLVLVAPGDFHMLLQRDMDHSSRETRDWLVRLKQGPPVWHQRPAVDVLFNSAVTQAGADFVGVILTGMGRDGAEGMRRLKQKGASTIAQDEESCVVFGMPKAAIDLGVVDHIVPLKKIPQVLIELAKLSHGKTA